MQQEFIIITATINIPKQDIVEIYNSIPDIPAVEFIDQTAPTQAEVNLCKSGMADVLEHNIADILNNYVDGKVANFSNAKRAEIKAQAAQLISVNTTEATIQIP